MVRPLTKTKKTGELYTRRPNIEACLAHAVRQAPATLRERAAVANPKDLQYLPSEALVHLSREALRTQDMVTAGTLINCLGRRCMGNLLRTIQASNLFDADEVRGEVQCKLYDLFADEAADPTNNALDFFEAQFNKAFVTLRFHVLRDVYRRNARFEAPLPTVALAADGGEREDDVSEVGDSANEPPDCDPVMQAESHELLRRIQALPAKEREAVMLKRLGFETESVDPQETTVATLCGVSGRAIRDRLRSAKARLKRMEEEKS
jgi:hypothetical protein